MFFVSTKVPREPSLPTFKTANSAYCLEISRIIASTGAQKQTDEEAAVNWIVWNSNQWVSYDDGASMQKKISKANELVCVILSLE